MMISLVDGAADDLDNVMDVMSSAFSDRFGEAWTRSQCAGILPMEGVRLVLAQDDEEEILGFALFRTVAQDAELLLLAVKPAVQGNGIGRKLLDHFIDGARNSGADRIHLEVRDGNPATRVYEAAGFVQCNRRPGYYRGLDGSQHDALTFLLAAGN